MKKRFLLFIAVVCFVAFLGCLVACTEKEPDDELRALSLAAPEKLGAEGRVVTWKAVENAVGYVVNFDRNDYETTSTTFNLFFSDAEGELELSVRAIGDGTNYTNSGWATTYVTLSKKVTQARDDSGLSYTLLSDREGYEVSYGTNDSRKGKIVIPDFFADLPVTRIADYGFGDFRTDVNPLKEINCNTVTTGVVFPKYLKTIGVGAFYCCVRLADVGVIPDAVTEIGGGAFSGCTHLTSIALPKGLKEIPANCFKNTALAEIVLPEQLERICDQAFYCQYLTPTNEHCYSELSEIVIPESVQYIGIGAFYGREKLKTITMSDKVDLRRGALDKTLWYENQPNGCVYLGTILYSYKGEMPENCELTIDFATTKAIGDMAFAGQKNLKKIYVEDGVKFLGECTFSSCSSLSEVRLPSDMTSILLGMFGVCESLKSIEIPKTVSFIDIGAFSGSGLETIYIPSGEIEDSAFTDCVALKEAVLADGVEYLGREAFKNCTALTKVVLPNTLKSIGVLAFSGCSSLETVKIPSSVIALGAEPFASCEKLTEVYYCGNFEQWDILLYSNNKDRKDAFSSATVYFYSEMQPSNNGNYWHYDGSGNSIKWNGPADDTIEEED